MFKIIAIPNWCKMKVNVKVTKALFSNIVFFNENKPSLKP